ncbi:MAG: hypothetical protein GTN90_01365 [Xanthomonadales bacterium]|nr:hypothetical protein [Xanthomonadales bacterium]
MPDIETDGVIYYRGKFNAALSVSLGVLLLGIAAVVLTQDQVAGIPFSQDLKMLATYLALPLGAVMVLAHVRHVLRRGPTVVAGKEGITVLYTPKAVGPIRWAEISGFKPFRHNGNPYLGITLDNPAMTLYPFREIGRPLVKGLGPKDAHLELKGKMMDDSVGHIAKNLEEMRLVHSWKR